METKIKTMKKLLLLTAITILSAIALGCSPEEGDRITGECECTRTNYEVTFQIVGSQTFWFTEELDSTIVPCQDEAQQVYYYEVNGIRRYYNITFTLRQKHFRGIFNFLQPGSSHFKYSDFIGGAIAVFYSP